MAEYKTKINDSKSESVNSLVDVFKTSDDYFFADYRGMTVEQMSDLRSKLREKNGSFRVVKNRFAKIAFENMKKPGEVADYLKGPTAVTLVDGESGPAAKILFDLAKVTPMEIKGGLVGKDIFDFAQLEAYSNLPTKSELISKLMATMMAPVQNIVYLLDAVPTKLVRTLQAVADSK